MNTPTPRIAAVTAEGPTALHLRWRGGGDAHAELVGWIATGGDVLAPLLSPAVFSAPRIAEHGAAVAWGDDDDLMIDAVHLEQIAAEQQPFGTAEIIGWQQRMRLSNQEAADFLGVSLSTWNAYKAGARIPTAVAMLCRAATRDPLLLQAHFRPRKAGRPRRAG